MLPLESQYQTYISSVLDRLYGERTLIRSFRIVIPPLLLLHAARNPATQEIELLITTMGLIHGSVSHVGRGSVPNKVNHGRMGSLDLYRMNSIYGYQESLDCRGNIMVLLSRVSLCNRIYR